MGTRRVRRKGDGEFTLFFRKVSPFSNHHPAEFDSDGTINFEKEIKRFSCTEQFYMYNKASLMEDQKLMSAVLKSDNPKAMKAMCSKGALRGWRDSEWNKHKEKVMNIGSKAKYRASPHLRYALFLSTGSQLVECSPFDPVWGIGNDLETVISDSSISLDTGQNLLGKILDRVREELWEDEQYRNEKEEVEKRLKLDADYLLKAMKHVDLMYKERATVRTLISMGHVSRDDQSYLNSEVRQLLPEWALPPPIEKFEPIRASPPVVIDFPRTPSRRSMTPDRISSILKRRRRSSSRLTLDRSWSRKVAPEDVPKARGSEEEVTASAKVGTRKEDVKKMTVDRSLRLGEYHGKEEEAEAVLEDVPRVVKKPEGVPKVVKNLEDVPEAIENLEDTPEAPEARRKKKNDDDERRRREHVDRNLEKNDVGFGSRRSGRRRRGSSVGKEEAHRHRRLLNLSIL
ncbi:hypothetical protein B9Z55_017026 [Caenorhabditis nigoni]|uniref:NADAR domain-containing protein n=1 Tax=Caenorhabditis nigoni TaxID=1611254 RepID=A0A2G5T7Q0_9PELO|nr:hypothetical protein B9Z55_017026 [Caenorhabditis nigoni]